jgi:hypothetical protein
LHVLWQSGCIDALKDLLRILVAKSLDHGKLLSWSVSIVKRYYHRIITNGCRLPFIVLNFLSRRVFVDSRKTQIPRHHEKNAQKNCIFQPVSLIRQNQPMCR